VSETSILYYSEVGRKRGEESEWEGRRERLKRDFHIILTRQEVSQLLVLESTTLASHWIYFTFEALF
jgi:hypothetical protein